MAIHVDKNLYLGVNPHLNSALQNQHGEWPSFHKDYIFEVYTEEGQRRIREHIAKVAREHQRTS
ncbi:MAG: hypothetical protein D6737_05215 [Chloroflexi bacterium]|nr:MAG: hypothetical protein CUN54_02040 [Phototrophicales bacterium]RMF81388.1 MAG: hypothetical protein D6737_05215 [Chloroflexota bacterium]